jgi:glyoxylase-like metal-dependent hydrolase (beta-lactamase superfamily II)
MLVDAGERGSAIGRKLGRQVDVLLLTHNDRDHVGGVPELLRSSTALGEVWLPYDWYLLYSAGADLVHAVRDGGTDLAEVAPKALERVTSAVQMVRHYLEHGARLNLGESPPASRRILWWLDSAMDSLSSGEMT